MRLEQERFSNKNGIIKCTFHAHFLGKLLKNDALQQMKEVEEKKRFMWHPGNKV